MGIKGFQGWLRAKHSKQVSHLLKLLIKNTKVRRLLFDLNALIHAAVNDVYGTEDKKLRKKMEKDSTSFWKNVVEDLADKIIFIILMVRPVYLVYLGADGSVSKAKILQQRQRTYKHESDKIFNRNNVKPGTEFMAFLSTTLRQSLKEKLNKLGNIIEDLIEKYPVVEKNEGSEVPDEIRETVESLKESEYRGPGEVLFSDSCKKGEGEHKIIKILRSKRNAMPGHMSKMVDVIYSPDADMHILSMMYLEEADKDKIVIMRHRHKKPGIKEPEYEFFYTSEIRKQLKSQGVHSMIDFAIISCFGGNDFVPALSYLKYGDGNTFETIKTAYTETFRGNRDHHIYREGQIDWNQLLLFLRALLRKSYMFMIGMGKAQLERPELFYNEQTGEDRRFQPLIKATKIQKPTKQRPGKSYEFHSDFFDKRYNAYITRDHHVDEKDDINYDTIPEMCRNYLEGITWVIEYYKQEGKLINQNWGYTFHYPPNPEDLYDYLESNLENPTWTILPTLASKKIDGELVPFEPFEPMEQLMAILRKEDLFLVPKILRILFLEKMPALYPEKILVDYTFIKFGDEHDAVALANFPDMDRIRELYSIVAEDPIVAARNKNHLQEKIWTLKSKK